MSSNAKTATETDPMIVRVVRWCTDHWSTIVLLILPALLSVAGLAVSSEVLGVVGVAEKHHPIVQRWAIWSIVIITAAHIVVGILHLCREKRLSQLMKELTQYRNTEALFIENASAMCTGYLADLGRWLGFGTEDQNSERITLYVHDSEKHFQQVGRFSFNQSYVKSGRSRYPDAQGCIGKAWENGWAFESLPEAAADPDGWLQACVGTGVPKSTAEKLNMQSACYAACTVRANPNASPVGVVVIESTKPDRFSQETLKQVIQEHRRGYMAWMIEALRFGDVSDARKEGF